MERATQPMVIGVFPNRLTAEGVVDELRHAGFRHDQIGIELPGRGVVHTNTAIERVEEKAAEGTAEGAILGGALGAVGGAVAFAALAGSGIGLGVILGAAAGAAVGTYAGPFAALRRTPEQVRQPNQPPPPEQTRVLVNAQGREADVLTIFHEHGGMVVSPAAARIGAP